MFRPSLRFSVLAALALLGCRSSAPRGTGEPAFFPEPPELPRVQFLRSFNGSQDFQSRRPFLDYLAGTEKSTEYEIKKPFSVAASKGKIYLTDSFGLQSVNVFDLERRRFYILGKEPGPGLLRKPIHVFVDAEGLKYVSDLERRQVVVYGVDDSYLRAYGDGLSFVPVSAVAYRNEIYILDVDRDKVKSPEGQTEEIRRDQVVVLDKESGKPLRRIGRHAGGNEGFLFASFLTVDRSGSIYVSDFLNHRVVKMDSEGNVLAAFGRHGDRAGDFSQMKGVAVDPDGLIYVVDAAFQSVQVFDNGGRPLFALGGPQAPRAPMDLPAGIWIDRHNVDYFRDLCAPGFEPEYLILVTNQLSSRHRLAVYAYGKRKGLEYPTPPATLGSAPAKPLFRLPVFPPESGAANEPPATAAPSGSVPPGPAPEAPGQGP